VFESIEKLSKIISIPKTIVTMCLRRSNHKVSQRNRNDLYALVLTFTLLFGKVCSDSNNNLGDNFASQRKISASGSGSGGTLEKRSSYAVISDAFSQTVNNEFGSEYTIARIFHLREIIFHLKIASIFASTKNQVK
jgi:hypothetical protein